jgi:hypothetical protein
MRINYCPECKKAGLKYERYPRSLYSNPPVIPTQEQKAENEQHHLINEKWCPRCAKWVKPEPREWHR